MRMEEMLNRHYHTIGDKMDEVTNLRMPRNFTPTAVGSFEMWYYEIQPGDGTKYELLIGWHAGEFGFPGSGDEYHMVVLKGKGWYYFNKNEFDGKIFDGKIEYFAKSLNCSKYTAEIVIRFITNLTPLNAKWLLSKDKKYQP